MMRLRGMEFIQIRHQIDKIFGGKKSQNLFIQLGLQPTKHISQMDRKGLLNSGLLTAIPRNPA